MSRPQFKGSTTARYVKNPGTTTQAYRGEAPSVQEDKMELVRRLDAVDAMMGFERIEDLDAPKKGWLVNMHSTVLAQEGRQGGIAAVDYYFLDEEGGSFKVSLAYDPYFYVQVAEGHEAEVEEWMRKALEGSTLKKVVRLEKDDLALPNHLVGLKRTLIKLSFHNISDLLSARRVIMPIVKENSLRHESKAIYGFNGEDSNRAQDPSEYIEEIREYDVPYHVRVSIDKGIHVGKWYTVTANHGEISVVEDPATLAFADPVVLAFDIETTKAPLKFPDSKIDQIMMISYMIDGEGFLITNREIISDDIDDFEYTPKPEYPGLFTIFNEKNEKAVLRRFFEHIRDARPTVIATYNGDFFDWPFVDARAAAHDLNLFDEIGFAKDSEDEYKSAYCVHMDCYRWVKRDSYLPQGSQGLKAVTTAKLGYNPTELDPELMTPYAFDQPQLLAEYSVSDAVATFYLYSKYVHPFIFSLCTILPLNPDEVLRKGTGTLCEMLLSVKAYEKDIVLPNKHVDPVERFFEGHLIESETYVGGHVESLEAGVFRSDIPCTFNVDPSACDEVIGNLHNSLKFCIEVENGKKMEDITNYQEVYDEIKKALETLRDEPRRTENPLIYHVDVASMYPNIMTSNRLQPDSLKSEKDCATCDFNRPNKTCDRRLPWSWRGEYFPAEMNEYNMVKRTLQNEQFPPLKPWLPARTFDELPYSEQAAAVRKRVSDYSRKVYNRIKQTKVVTREAIICQRENPFYVDTVRSFRDRRYDFKGLTKVWKGKLGERTDPVEREEAKKMIVLYDSLQLAHKVILNSFYGYVMRKGSRWYSMEMAGVTCLTGAHIIQMARKLVERFGRPLELDTDGIWCILPATFPENFKLKTSGGKGITVEFPCSMLNYLVHQQFTNHQYQDLVDPATFKYATRSDNSIFFEVDGPYKAMILPTSKEEGKGLKKRYAVFNEDNSLAELKGFELKRRGELRLIKNFQSDIFKLFLEGNSLESCYGAVAAVANNWLDVLDTRGGMLEDEDLIELICENRSMSKPLREYAGQKSTSITTAKRLGEFLGEEMVQDAGLATKYIISAKPIGTPVTERAIPVAIFSSEKKELYLKKWLRDPRLTKFGPRDVIDWDYYRERLASVVQKIITIPAALQGVKNPVPRVPHPEWLQKRIAIAEDKKQQSSINRFFTPVAKTEAVLRDLEDFGKENVAPTMAKVTTGGRKRKQAAHNAAIQASIDEQDESVLQGQCPDPTLDYVAFLEYQKAKWRRQHKAKDRRTRLFGTATDSTSRSAMGDILRRQAESVVGTSWEILEYKPDPAMPGAVKAYVLASGKIHSFTFHIPRKVYASFKVPLSERRLASVDGRMEPSQAVVPHGGQGHLYRLETTEAAYQQMRIDGDSVLNDATVLAVYESQVSPLERATIDLGSTVAFDGTQVGALGRGLKQGFPQSQLAPVKDATYLQRFNLDTVFLLQLVVNGYSFYAIFRSWDRDVDLLVLKPTAGAQEVTMNFDKAYRDIHAQKKAKFDPFYQYINYETEAEFTTTYYSNEAKLMKKLSSRLAKINEGRSTKCLYAVQAVDAARLVAKVPVLQESPCIRMATSELTLGAIGWHSLIAKRIVNHYFVLASWISNLVGLCRYANVPLCNLQIENLGYVIDVAYSRRLQQQNMVLWWSKGPLPDLGGFENDFDFDYDDKFEQFTHINVPEVYETACLGIDIGTLTINTILSSSLINDAEGSDLADDSSLTEFSPQALVTLKAVVKDMWDDALKTRNSNADAVMASLVQWVQKPQSYMYDYALHYHVHNLTTKCLLQLMNEFKRMNSSIVFANRNKFIVATSKVLVENSYSYGDYMTKLVQSKPIFNFLSLQVTKYWDILVWMDQYNYAGRFTKEITNDEVQPLTTASTWLIQQYLPKIYQQEFHDCILIFLDALVKNKQEVTKGTQSRTTQLGHRVKNEEDEPDSVVESFRASLESRIKKLLKRQNNLILSPEYESEYRFPTLAGSHLHMSNPCLELVKFLTEVFGLSKRRELEVRLLRKDLLAVFNVKEFAKSAAFSYPAAELVIPHFICDYCSFIREIDVCREPEERVWNCSRCSKPYNRVAIEEQLIHLLEKLYTRYLQQDFVCNKCLAVRERNLSLHCKCSGSWEESLPAPDMEKRKQVFTNVAKLYKLQLLEEVI